MYGDQFQPYVKRKKKKKSNVSAFRDLSNKVLLVVLLNDSTCGRSTDVSAKSKFICSWSSTYCRTSHYFLIFNLFDFGSKAIAHLFKDALLNLWFAQYVTSFIFFLWPGLKYIKDLPSVCIVHAEAMKQWLTVLNCTKEYCKKNTWMSLPYFENKICLYLLSCIVTSLNMNSFINDDYINYFKGIVRLDNEIQSLKGRKKMQFVLKLLF